jgi:hypothetical protein
MTLGFCLSVVTPFGKLSKPEEVPAGKYVGATGRWNGYAWRGGAGSWIPGNVIHLYLGQIEETREVFLGYDVKNPLTRDITAEVTLYLAAPTEVAAEKRDNRRETGKEGK